MNSGVTKTPKVSFRMLTHNLDSIGYHILNLLDLVELIPAHDVLTASNHHASHEATEGGDAVSLANAENRGVDVGGTSLESGMAVGNSAASIVVEMYFNVAGNNAAEGPYKVVDLTGGSASDSVSNTDTVDTDAVDGAVQLEEVDKVGSEAVFGREADLNSSALDVVDNLDSGLLDRYHILAVGVFPEKARGADNKINSVH